jgi:hypothetical protein
MEARAREVVTAVVATFGALLMVAAGMVILIAVLLLLNVLIFHIPLSTR